MVDQEIKNDVLGDLILGYPIRQVARRNDVGESSIWRWLKTDDEFKEALTAGIAPVVGLSALQLAQTSQEAVIYLREVLHNKGNSTALRMRAARTILNHTLRYMETADLAERLAALEEMGDEQEATRATDWRAGEIAKVANGANGVRDSNGVARPSRN